MVNLSIKHLNKFCFIKGKFLFWDLPGNFHTGIKANFLVSQITVNSLMFARDLFGDFCDHIKIAKINTHRHNSGTVVPAI